MFIKFPNYKTFANIAICPTDSGKDEFHVIDCGEGVFIDFVSLSDGTSTCIPYRPGHMYVMYRGKDGEDVCAYVFKSEFEMKEYLKQYYGTSHLSGACLLNIPLFLEGEPAKVPLFVEFEEKNSEKSQKNKKKNKKSKKNKKNEISKKIIKTEKYKNNLKFRGGADFPKYCSIEGQKVPVSSDYKKLEKDSEEICSSIQDFIISTLASRYICQDLIDECISELFRPRPLRCKNCFITHFPWEKICKKNVKKMEPQNMRPKLRGGSKNPKHLLIDGKNVQDMLTILRSLDIHFKCGDHVKCPITTKAELCEFCLIRSLIGRANSFKGREKIIPQEFLALNIVQYEEMSLKSCIEHVIDILKKKTDMYSIKINSIHGCTLCPPEISLFLDFSSPIVRGMDISYILKAHEQSHCKDHNNSQKYFNQAAEVFFFVCDEGVSVNIQDTLQYQSKQWKVKSVVGKSKSICYVQDNYYVIEDKSLALVDEEVLVVNATFVAFEAINSCVPVTIEDAIYSRDEIKKLTDSILNRRKGDRHVTPRYGDRHRDNKTDRHLDRLGKGLAKKLLQEIKEDTGMDCVCCICAELRSTSSCVLLETLSRDKMEKYIIESEETRNLDGNFYVCSTCKLSILNNKDPVRGQKEFLGLLDFPDSFKDELQQICQPSKKGDINIRLNKLEDFALKLVIPFIRILHLPRGPYLKVKGDLIMMSSEISDSLNKILPQNQDLIPVAFRRNLAYKGHFIEEYVDRNKIGAYFNFLKANNHLYEDFIYDSELFDKFEQETMKEANENIPEDNSEEDEETDPGKALFDLKSLIVDKYKEDTNQNTVVAKIADMVIQVEEFDEEGNNEEVDPEDEFFPEDEVDICLIDEDDVEDPLLLENLSEDDLSIAKQYFKLKKVDIQLSKLEIESLCKCSLTKFLGKAVNLLSNLSKLNADSPELSKLIDLKVSNSEVFIEKIRERNLILDSCSHTYNDMSEFLNNIVFNKNKMPHDIKKYVEDQKNLIYENLKKISIAPGEKGQFQNWGSDIFLEEKLFPNLFPYGIGGFLSSNVLRRGNMGFSNYVKTRLLSVNSKFRDDPFYVFFLLLVKELVDIRRSEKTFFRKATKVPKLNASTITETNKEFLMRNNNVFTAYKTLRGTAMYYESIKKNLMAFLRQKGCPTLFCTFSAAEFDWSELAQKIYETKEKQKCPMDFLDDQNAAWKNKLIAQNVVQSTMHFSKRTDKLISLLTRVPMFEHEGVEYRVSSYFYRVEFQTRGAPHLHLMFWLEGENGEIPPSLFSDENGDTRSNGKKIAEFAKSCMHGSVADMSCPAHPTSVSDCVACKELQITVRRYQTHSHKQTCMKKNKIIRINAEEGHGINDGKIEDNILMIPTCRFSFPKNPIDDTEFLLPFPDDYDLTEFKKAKRDYFRIRKYLLRLTHSDEFREDERWKNFEAMSFNEFLFNVGMFESGKDIHDNTAFQTARSRYLTALRCEVKTSGLLLLRRQTQDIMTNNFNKNLIRVHSANQDIQMITDPYAVAEYLSKYCVKAESGQSALLQNINQEAVQTGQTSKETLRRLTKQLDKGRECSMQEAIYRVLGFTMTKFSHVVRFINTHHPDHREGLLKSNLQELDEGESIFCNSLHDYYQDRPKNSQNSEIDWDGMCLADFVANFNVSKSKPKSPNAIILQNKRGFIVKRSKECVIRYFLKYEHENEYYRALCILFLPFRDENAEIHHNDVVALYKENEDSIENIRLRFESHRDIVQAIGEQEEKRAKLDESSDDETDDDHSDVETTTAEEMKDFQNYVKVQAQNQIRKYNEGKEVMSEDEYLSKINSLNSQQRKIFDDFNERITDPEDEIPFYLYIGGEAGTGKSYLLNLMIQSTNRLPNYSGQSLDKPRCLVMAPTGVAAYIVKGSTIDSSLGIQPQSKRKSFTPGSASRNSNMRFLYEDVKVIFLDEASMCGNSKFTIMNYRLQEIMGNTKFMGGVSVVSTGDFGQLPPVKESMIWENSDLDGRIDIAPNHWDENMKIYHLTEKMRSQDEEFSKISDKVRKGICDADVINYMTSHIRECPSEENNEMFALGKLSIIVLTNAERERINQEKLRALLPNEKEYIVSSNDKSTNVRNALKTFDKLPLTQTGQLESKLIFKKHAPVQVSTNHNQLRYKNNGLGKG